MYHHDFAENDASLDVVLTSVLDSDVEAVAAGHHGTLRECIMTQTPDIELLRILKDWANLQRTGVSRSMPTATAGAIYHLTVAAALVHGNERITQAQRETLSTGMRWVAEQSWMEDEMRDLILTAAGRIEAEGNEADGA